MEGGRRVMARRTVFLMPVYNPARDVLLRTVDSLLGANGGGGHR